MKEKKVISSKSFPRKPPLNITILAAASCKAFSAPEWVWGAVGLFMILLWIAYITKVATEKEIEVDLLNQKGGGIEETNGQVTKDWKDLSWEEKVEQSRRERNIKK